MVVSNELVIKIEEDISKSTELLKQASYDIDQMSKLFHYLMSSYESVIDGFCSGLRISQPFDSAADQAKVYNSNVALLIDRLIGFRENRFDNTGLMEYYLKKDYSKIAVDVNFHDLRMDIGMFNKISHLEKQEIITKIGEIEEICSKVAFKKEKWELLREYMVWLSGKDVDVVMKVLPIFLQINNKNNM